MSIDDAGGPAFPFVRNHFDDKDGTYEGCSQYSGMSLRDYFATHAPITDRILQQAREASGRTDFSTVQILAKLAYDYADAMIAEREKRERPT